MSNYSHAFAAAEARELVRCLMEINHDRGEGIDLIHTVQCRDGRTVTGQLAFAEEDPRSLSIVRSEEPPGHVHENVAWDEIVGYSVKWG
ncbi:MAG TPA: hypothetical protein VN238_12775 [Solirubrobacteraceae bacterium]|nr:hypothetical protein [Solirubrobacteraceae bacterium]